MDFDHPLNPDLDLVLEREVPLPPEALWAAWTTPALMVQWFTPAPWKTVSAELDLRPGGGSLVVMESPEGERFPNPGCYLMVDPPRRLVFTSALLAGFRPAPSGPDDMPFTGVLTFTPQGAGSLYVARAIHGKPEDCRRHAEMGFHAGWGAALDQLVALMTREAALR